MNIDHFSITFLPRKIKIYKMKDCHIIIQQDNIMCQTIVEDEITVYKYISDDDGLYETHSIIFDPREYTVINIHEDVQGIDHVGIVNYISGLFYKENIPLLYINTYSYNLILISDDYIEQAKKILSTISIGVPSPHNKSIK